MKTIGAFLSIILFLTVLIVLLAACANQAELTPGLTPPIPTPTVDRLAAPPMPDEPTQADLGAQVFYQVCMACHGDWGQGLTDEWRAVWEEDGDCWQSGCHWKDHPEHGFLIEKDCCPAVIGSGTLAGFDNAMELFEYNVENMPWWNPGYLTEDEFWQVTAFLMRSHDALPEGVVLSEGNAHVFQLRPTASIPDNKYTDILFLSGILAAVAALIIIQNRLR